ncbi:MAG: sulfite exporter TauE/SafE family protein [Vicingaceae bacterium]
MIGRPVRLFLFWKHIEWRLVAYYVPSAILGAILGGLIFVKLKADWLQVLLGLFLISTVIQYRFGKKQRSFAMKKWYFIPLGFGVTLVSTLFGATGPILNPFYLNLGLVKERMIATKTANSFIAGLAQLSSYTFLGALHGELWWYGLIIGAGATIGNLIGKRQLQKLSDEGFRKIVIAVMVVSGLLMVGRSLVN